MNDNDKIYMEESRAVLIRGEARENVVQPLLRERQLVLYVNGREETSFSCTPERIEELILGYLLSEGEIESLDEVTGMEIGRVQAEVICRRNRPEKERARQPAIFKPEEVRQYISLFFERSFRHRKTHASHKAMLFTAGQDSRFLEADDVSRRSAVEKVIGLGLKERIVFEQSCLMFSGRVPADVVRKMKQVGIPLLIGRSYPTWEAVQEAKKSGLILCGNAREDSFVLYAGNL